MREVRGQFVLRSKCGFNAWPSEVYNRAQVAGGQRRQFGPADLLLVCPALYRAATYGSGWASVWVTHFFCRRPGSCRRGSWTR